MTPHSTPSKADFQDLKAVFLNCTLKKSPTLSHTEGLMKVPQYIMHQHGVSVTPIRAVDYDLAPGVQPDMTEHGFSHDDWPQLWKVVQAADIIVIGTPVWLGEKSSVCTQVIERLYAQSAQFNDKGQYIYYGKVGGCIITGNEDGAKHCSMNILYSLQRLGCVIPPQADAYWNGEAGPGPSYLDENSGGPQSKFTQLIATFMAWNLMHMARLLKSQNLIPRDPLEHPDSRDAGGDGRARADDPDAVERRSADQPGEREEHRHDCDLPDLHADVEAEQRHPQHAARQAQIDQHAGETET
ncbi:MAG: NAD(P)H-dependent oxidoreductase, partial [Nitrococcus sp.]|nr:NAD(P)H-dependent oxidoreductase [Nitrococcus sp.]